MNGSDKPDSAKDRYRAIVEDQSEMISRHLPDGTRTFVNASYCKSHGKTKQELLGQSAYSGLSADDLKRLKEIYNSLTVQNPSSEFELSYTGPDGETVWQLWTKRAFFDDDGQANEYQSVGHDITSLKRAETLNARLGRIVDGSLNEIYVFDAQSLRFIQVNHGARANLGYSMAELRDLTPLDIKPEVNSREFAQLLAPLRDGSENKITFETVHQRKDGSTYDVEIHLQLIRSETPEVFVATIQDITERKLAEAAINTSNARFRDLAELGADWFWEIDENLRYSYFSHEIHPITGDQTDQSIGQTRAKLGQGGIEDEVWSQHLETLNAHRPFRNFDYKFVNPEGRIFYLSISGKPTFDEAGNFTGYRGAGTDVTHQTTLEQKLKQSQKMEAVGQLTGGIAHDFNNILGVIQGNLELLKEQIDEIPGVDDSLFDAALKATVRGAELTQNMLAFSRKQDLHPEATNLGAQILNMISILQRTLGEAIAIEVQQDKNLWNCDVDPGQVEAALLNLALNARDAMPGGGTLSIETRNVFLDDEYASAQTELAPGNYIMLAVSDTGAGIFNENLPHVFEPFYTTKEVGKGTGLGLSMVYGFAKQSGGHVTIYSEPGHGTTVKIYLPRSDDQVGETQSNAGEDQKTGDEIILIVEDDPELRTLAVALVSSMGYRIREAKDGPSALANFEKQGAIDLLLTDVVLPGGMNGVELAERITQIQPTAKTLFMSGYTEDAFLGNKLVDKDNLILQKPFRKKDLASRIRQALDS